MSIFVVCPGCHSRFNVSEKFAGQSGVCPKCKGPIERPALVMAAYTVLRDDELEPYQGRALYLRVAICALAYVALWGVFIYLSDRVDTSQPWNWLLVAPPLVITGALAALASLDLDFGSGSLHYAFYVLVTALLRWVAGMGWLWENVNPPAG